MRPLRLGVLALLVLSACAPRVRTAPSAHPDAFDRSQRPAENTRPGAAHAALAEPDTLAKWWEGTEPRFPNAPSTVAEPIPEPVLQVRLVPIPIRPIHSSVAFEHLIRYAVPGEMLRVRTTIWRGQSVVASTENEQMLAVTTWLPASALAVDELKCEKGSGAEARLVSVVRPFYGQAIVTAAYEIKPVGACEAGAKAVGRLTAFSTDVSMNFFRLIGRGVRGFESPF